MVLRSWPRCRAIAEIVQPLRAERVRVHIFLPCEHERRAPFGLVVVRDRQLRGDLRRLGGATRVDGTRKLNRARHPKVDHLRRQPGSIRAREEVGVERGGLGGDPPVASGGADVDLARSARVVGCSRNTVRAALASDAPPKYSAQAGGVDRGRGRAADPGVAAGVSDDAGDGDRRADRLDPLDPGAVGLGWPSCARRICRRTRPRAPATRRARSRSAICGSRRSRCRSGSARPASRRSCRC